MKPFVTLGIALGLGLLIGLQRERTDSRLGGIRTFPLICLFGAFCGMLAQNYGGWTIGAGIIAIFATLSIANCLASQRPEGEHGKTTEIAALLTFAIGAYLPAGDPSLAALATGLVVILLHLKEPMHTFVQKMGPKDMTGLVHFVVVSMIVLPLVPDRTYGPFHVFNPHDIWRMVVLIVGISLTGYVIFKVIGGTASAIVGGILGGLISSTATTVSHSRRATLSPNAHSIAVTVIMIASAVTYFRVLVEVSIVAPAATNVLAPPLLACAIWVSIVAVGAWFLLRCDHENMPEPANPAELKSAFVFGLLYAVIAFATAAAKLYFGPSALLGVAVVSGLTDMDAITLSLSHMAQTNQLDPTNAWRLIVVASLANLVFKGAIASFVGGLKFGTKLAPFFIAAFAGCAFLIWSWPEGWALPAE